jgi:hypothetical protein
LRAPGKLDWVLPEKFKGAIFFESANSVFVHALLNQALAAAAPNWRVTFGTYAESLHR